MPHSVILEKDVKKKMQRREWLDVVSVTRRRCEERPLVSLPCTRHPPPAGRYILVLLGDTLPSLALGAAGRAGTRRRPVSQQRRPWAPTHRPAIAPGAALRCCTRQIIMKICSDGNDP